MIGSLSVVSTHFIELIYLWFKYARVDAVMLQDDSWTGTDRSIFNFNDYSILLLYAVYYIIYCSIPR